MSLCEIDDELDLGSNIYLLRSDLSEPIKLDCNYMCLI